MPLTRRALLTGAAGLGAAGLSGAAWAGYVEPRLRLTRTAWRPAPPRWPADLRLRIVVVADVHCTRPTTPLARVEEIVAFANAQQGDLVALLGDYGGATTGALEPPEETARLLAGLRAPLGVWAVLGNHDWWDDPDAMRRRAGPTLWRRALEAQGLPVLENASVRLTHRGRPFHLAGLGSQEAFRPFGGGGADDLAATLAPLPPDEPAILLAHEPDIFARVPDRIPLTLSGHTHGGQVRLAGWSPMVPSRYGNRYAYGLVAEGPRRLVVSGGLGCSLLPVRFGVPPEVTVVELGA